MIFKDFDIPLQAVTAYNENCEKDVAPTIEEGIAHILSVPEVQVVVVMRLINDLSDQEILKLFRGYHDEYDIDSDRMWLRDSLLEKARKQ